MLDIFTRMQLLTIEDIPFSQRALLRDKMVANISGLGAKVGLCDVDLRGLPDPFVQFMED